MPWPGLEVVYAAWLALGPACGIEGGGMVSPHLVDHRAQLYQPRRAWLDEHGVRGEEREVYDRLWAALDAEDLAFTRQLLDEALKG